MKQANQKFHIMTIVHSERQKSELFLLKPGDLFEEFGGSRHGLLVRKTPSVVVSRVLEHSRDDSEYDASDPKVWQWVNERIQAGDTFEGPVLWQPPLLEV